MRAATGAMIAALLLIGSGRAQGDDHGRITLEEENDFFAPDNRDRHYTQGAQLNYLSPDLGVDGMAAPMTWLGSLLPVFQDGSTTTSRRFDLFVGQELFTPQNKRLHNPDPRDRPYAGWLNGGIGFIQDADEQTLDHLEVQVGLMGPGALGKQTQNNFHLAIDDPESEGWGFQLRNEPTLDSTTIAIAASSPSSTAASPSTLSRRPASQSATPSTIWGSARVPGSGRT